MAEHGLCVARPTRAGHAPCRAAASPRPHVTSSSSIAPSESLCVIYRFAKPVTAYGTYVVMAAATRACQVSSKTQSIRLNVRRTVAEGWGPMSEELELTGGSAGIDRRDFIRKSAIVGGMVWAAPMIQSIGSPAFAGTEINGENGEGDCKISAIQIYLANDSAARYKVGWYFVAGQWEIRPESAAAPPCVKNLDSPDRQLLTEWCAATDALTVDGLDVDVTAVLPGNEDSKARVVVDDSEATGNYYLEWIVIKSGTDCYLIEYANKETKTDTFTCGDGRSIGFETGEPAKCSDLTT